MVFRLHHANDTFSSLRMITMTSPSLETFCAIHAYKEEFQYYADEAPEAFLELCIDLFTENHGDEEASKVNWEAVEHHYTA